MACRVFQDGRWRDADPDQLDELLAQPGSFAWIELRDSDSTLLRTLGTSLDLHELAIEDALAARQRPKIEEYAHGFFLVLRTVQEWNQHLVRGETHVFLGPRYLICVRHGLGPGYHQALERLESGRFAPNPGAALYVLLDHIVDAYRPVVDRLQERYESYESSLLETGLAQEALSRIYLLKRETLLLGQAISPMADMVQELIRLHPEVVEKGLKPYYRDVQDHLARLGHAIDEMQEMLSDAMHISLATLALRQNESVQKLAGWGAILAVPTLVFSLYGMNFKLMPELGWPWGYPLALFATAAGCYGLYRRLKHAGWI